MTKLIAQICYILQLHRLAYFFNRDRKRIITFHNVLPDDCFEKNVANGVSCSLSDFKTIIDEISRFYGFSLDLDDAKTVTVTFDDGYQNQVEIAAPYLFARGIPAYLFVSGQLLPPNSDDGERNEEARPLTIDLLLHWVSYVPNGEYKLRFGERCLDIHVTDNNRLQIWSSVLWPAFLDDSISKGVRLLNALDATYPIDSVIKSLPKKYAEQRLGCPTIEQLNELRTKGWEIGWHTYSHYPLAKLSHEEKIKELMSDLKCPSKVLSFPFGGPQEVDCECLEIAKSMNYSTAVSNVNVVNTLSGKWFRSRMSLSPEPALLHFELSGLRYIIKHRKLLPKI
ncbi:polysaccharide deacetylase family protein [Bacteroides congonensis]|uniref:polysaccharide deacetylase family protein n=1 Tax=Bacteroides congonensis TaxID=1871006 RepID=UPI0009342E16|nr:polysaccharide deacetylase family protein [Bacteroides congonensis]